MRPREISVIQRGGLPQPHLSAKYPLGTRKDPMKCSYSQAMQLCNTRKLVIPLIDVETDSVLQFTCQIQNVVPIGDKENISSGVLISNNHIYPGNALPYNRKIRQGRISPRKRRVISHRICTIPIRRGSSSRPDVINTTDKANLKVNLKPELYQKKVCLPKPEEYIVKGVTTDPIIVLERLSDKILKQYETPHKMQGDLKVILHRLPLNVLKRYNIDTSKWNQRFKSRKVKILQKNRLYFQCQSERPVLLACEARSRSGIRDQRNRPKSSQQNEYGQRKHFYEVHRTGSSKKGRKTSEMKWQEQQLLRLKRWEIKNYGWMINTVLEEKRKYRSHDDHCLNKGYKSQQRNSVHKNSVPQLLNALGLMKQGS